MKRILYIVDFDYNSNNSVVEALNYFIKGLEDDPYQHTLFYSEEIFSEFIKKKKISDKIYCLQGKGDVKQVLKNKDVCFLKKIVLAVKKLCFKTRQKIFGSSKVIKKEKIIRIKKIIKKSKPDLIFFFGTPSLLKDFFVSNIPYVFVLYDTFVESPRVEKAYALQLEGEIIEKSKGYFIPHFFFEDYLNAYNSNKIIKYNFPAVVEKNTVLSSYQNAEEKYVFSYFGQVQTFRNAEKIEAIFRKLNLKLDVFTYQKDIESKVFIVHEPIGGEELYQVVANSRYLVVFDNSKPYHNYLPSKVYLYASFTKPIIIFGDNKNSATIRFFKDYPNCYYQNINEPLNGLMDFLSKEIKEGFNEELYNKYLDFLPKNAVKPIVKTIQEILN